MKSIKTLLLLSCCLLFLIGKAQQINYLHYTSTSTDSTKKGVKKTDNGTMEFFLGKEQLRIVKTYPNKTVNGSTPVKIINTKDNYQVLEYTNQRDYFVEELNKLYSKDTLKPTGIKARINGYNCEKFEIEIYGSIYGRTASSYWTYQYDLWVTNDIQVDNSYNKYFIPALCSGKTTFPFNGVIVKAERSASDEKEKFTVTIVLDKKINNPEAEKEYEWPWKKPDFTAMLPEDGGQHGSINENYTNEKYKDQCERMRILLRKVTGNENIKYGRRPLNTIQ